MNPLRLRDLRKAGAKAVGARSSAGEPRLLEGRDQAFVLLPVTPENRTLVLDFAEGLAAVMALRQDQLRAVEAGLDQLGLGEIKAEIRAARKGLRHRSHSA